MSSLSERLAELKKKKKQSQQENRKALQQDYQEQRLKSAELKALQRKKDDAENDLQKIELGDKQFQKLQNLKYSLKQCEDWEELQEKRKEAKQKAGTHNYSTLAEQTYRKHVENYFNHEDHNDNDNDNDNNDDHSNNNDNDNDNDNEIGMPRAINKKTGGKFAIHKPKKTKVEALVKNIKETIDKKTSKRRPQSEKEFGYINEKNKQFNMKLDRDYKN